MAANEIPNLVLAQIKFTAANPPVLVASAGIKQASLARVVAGQYTFQFADELAQSPASSPTTVLCSANDTAAASFAAAAEAPVGGLSGMLVNVRNLAGALADTGAFISIEVHATPTRS